MLAAVALVLGVYALGSLLFARAVGLGAAVLTVGNTAIFVDATAPLPDLLAATLFVWAVVLAIAVRQGRSAVVATPRRRVAAMLAIGVILGWSYLAREFIVFVWPLIPVILFRRVSIRDLFWIAVPLGAIGLAEMALNQHIFGDPLARLRVASEHGSGVVPEEAAATYQNKRRLWYLAQLGVAIGDVREGAWLNAALGAAVAGALVWPRRLGLLLLWIALLYVPLVLLGGVLNPDAPMLRLFKVRYWYPIVPAILLGGVAAAWLATRFVAGRLGASEHRRGLMAGPGPGAGPRPGRDRPCCPGRQLWLPGQRRHPDGGVQIMARRPAGPGRHDLGGLANRPRCPDLHQRAVRRSPLGGSVPHARPG